MTESGGRTPAPVVLTGTSGFVGGHLARALCADGAEVRSFDRGMLEKIASGVDAAASLRDSAGVIHLAARAHVLGETSASLLDVYRRTNRDLTLQLARAAAAADVPRFVFVSSIRVNGSASVRPFHAGDPPNPDEPYAISKLEAERGLWAIAKETGLQVVVVRPPLVYGPGVKANFLRLLGLAESGLPLPLASVDGQRSLIGVRNLCDLLRRCLWHPGAASATLLASDGEDISLPSLIRDLAEGMGRPARLFPAPVRLVRGLAALAGKGATFDKLTASLQIDATPTFLKLDWSPPLSLREGLRETARWYRVMRHTAGLEADAGR
jgi:nucleoside-diphosphate-sugar epimerase